MFKKLPGHEMEYTPDSEYLLQTLQPSLEDQFFLGNSYEDHFDRYEVFQALVYADVTGGEWGPPGRFSWKHSEEIGLSPFLDLIGEAESQGNDWPPLRSGLFGGSIDRFKNVTSQYQTRILDKSTWF